MKTMKKTVLGAVAALASSFAMGALADTTTVWSSDYSSLGAIETPGSITASFAAGAGAATLDFQLAGYSSLDGDNYYIDIFHLSVNNHEIYSSTFDLGGGGANRVLLAPDGATATRGAGQYYDVSVPIALVNGANKIVFSYDSPISFEGSPRAGFQGLGDEGWGVNHASVTAAVPEPQTWALLLSGAGFIGLASRRKLGASKAR